MERPAKRPRLLTRLDSGYAGFGNRHEYHDTSDDELNNVEGLHEEDGAPTYDPDEELQRKRARVDFKLKSTFEAIFEKYGKNFEGIGDEIDMRTGEVVVNNGHLFEMRHEMDAGDPWPSLNGQRSWSGGDDDSSGSEEEDDAEVDDQDGEEDGTVEEDEEDYDDEDDLSDGDMMEEDDLILRGFAEASQQFKQRHPPQDARHSGGQFAEHLEPRRRAIPCPNLPGGALPSPSEILLQFGPHLGPEIVKYISEKDALESKHIEPAWRVPGIVTTAPSPPSRRPLIKSMVRQSSPEPERSPSPENAPSIWALTNSRRRKKFSEEEDKLLLNFVADAKRHGLSLSSQLTWRQLEDMNPRHDWAGWKAHYVRQFTYLHPGPLEESDLSTSEISASTDRIPDKDKHFGSRLSYAEPAPPRPSRPTDAQRPARIRKPAQRQGIVSWSEAVATIASVDPLGNAGLLDDVRRTTGISYEFENPVSSSPSALPGRANFQDERNLEQPLSSYVLQHSHPLGTVICTDSLSSGGDELALHDPAFSDEGNSTEKVPCPHADCRLYPTTVYRLERSYDEELSPMRSHLLRGHNMAPFPCGELKCERKGARGYLMQRDLVQHVREAHPYATALPQLRGRVDPALWDQNNHFDRPVGLIETRRRATSHQQPRDSDFIMPQRAFRNDSPSSGQTLWLGSSQDPTLTPRPRAPATSDGTSSMHFHSFSATGKNMPSCTSRQRSTKSDVQRLDKNPFPKNSTAEPRQAGRPDWFEEPTASEKPAQLKGGSGDPFAPNIHPKIACQYPGCGKLISNHSGNMPRHLRTHQKHSRPSTTFQESDLKSNALLPATIPNSQSSTNSALPGVGPPMSVNVESSSAPQSAELNIAVPDGFIDRTYEFSDEEEGIRPVVRRQAPQTARPPKVKSPQSVLAPVRPPTRPETGTSRKSGQAFVTPVAKDRRKSTLRNVLDSEDFDELSLATDGFILLSARRKPFVVHTSALPDRVKIEESDNHVDPGTASKKRKLSSLEDDNEIDELAEDGPLMLTPHQLGPISMSKPPPKKIAEELILQRMRPTLYPKSRKRLSDRDDEAKPGSSLRVEVTAAQTPTKQPQLPAKTNTPLIDMLKGSQLKRNEPRGSSAEIPSTSELGSSPDSHRARTRRYGEAAGKNSPVTVLVTPYKPTWVGGTVKQEDEECTVVTPGGTLRKCAQDGFVCERAFCFRCYANRNIA